MGRLVPGMAVAEMDQATFRIDVLNRVLQGSLPAGKQHRRKQQTRE